MLLTAFGGALKMGVVGRRESREVYIYGVEKHGGNLENRMPE